MTLIAKCPKCTALHEPIRKTKTTPLKWTGNGMPRILCKKCIKSNQAKAFRAQHEDFRSNRAFEDPKLTERTARGQTKEQWKTYQKSVKFAQRKLQAELAEKGYYLKERIRNHDAYSPY